MGTVPHYPMNKKRHSCFLAGISATVAVALAQSTAPTDPHITSWQLSRSGAYARVWETTADKNAGNAVASWPRAGLLNRGGGQSTATYSDVERVVYSNNYVYIYTTGLASYTMGPWLDPNGGLFGMWPANRGAIHQVPRNPTIPTTKTLTRGVGGVLVNGVYLWNNGDAQSYTTSTGQVSFNGQGLWNRLAGPTEGPTFDSGNAHQPQNGQYHNHVNPRALRYQLGDAVSYTAATKTYSEATPTHHSPILGWANDGLPIYGPYGYSDAMSSTSGVRRMTSGFTKRDGTLGTANLTATGRTTLPAWVANATNRSATLASTQYGPAVNTTYPIGTFSEDYEYLGDLGKTHGVDFDLNRQNVRFCVTPEFPNGTYAYFTCIDAAGNSVFPDVIGLEFFGAPSTMQGTVNAINEPVTEYARGGEASAIAVTAASTSAGIVVSWSSVEGGTYVVATSSDGTTFTTLASGITSGGLTTTLTTNTAANYYRVTLTAVATYDTLGNGGVSGLNVASDFNYAGGAPSTTSATPTSPSTPGATGTARLVNLATRAFVGAGEQIMIPGFVVSGSGTTRLLIRAIGPTLASFGVSGVLADPQLTLFSGTTTIAANDNWSSAANSAEVTSAAASAGAFALTNGSRDAALLVELAAGSYTVAVSGVGGATGTALVEIYVVN